MTENKIRAGVSFPPALHKKAKLMATGKDLDLEVFIAEAIARSDKVSDRAIAAQIEGNPIDWKDSTRATVRLAPELIQIVKDRAESLGLNPDISQSRLIVAIVAHELRNGK